MYAFTRSKGGAAVLCAVNIAAEARAVPAVAGRQWRGLFSGETVALSPGQPLAGPAHRWQVLVSERVASQPSALFSS